MATLSDLYTHLKTLCEQWFYNKSQIDSQMANKINKSSTSGLVKNDGSIDTNTYLTSVSLTGYEQTTNKTSSWNSTTNNTRYPTEKLVKDSLDGKLDNKLGSQAEKPLITGANGYVELSSFGTTSGTFAEGNHTHTGTYAPNSHTHGYILNDGSITEMISTYDKTNLPLIEENGKIKLGAISGDYIKSDSELVNLRVSASANLNSVLGSIDTAIGNLSSINAINIVTTLPTASADTMSKLYIVSENSKVNVYYTEMSGTSPNYTYSWHKMDTDILDELSINWSDIQNNPFSSASPSDYATSSHTHGNLSNDGKIGSNANYFVYTTTGGAVTSKQKIGNITTGGAIGSTANKPIITTTNGALTTGSFGTSANTFCQGNDSRLSDARTPTSHTHGNLSNDGKISTSGTSGGNIVITTSTNAVAVDTTINVIDALVQDLITYGSS